VTIAILWPDAIMAYRLVEAAQQNFLEARHAAETSAIAESIAILEQNLADPRTSPQVPASEQAITVDPSGDAEPTVRHAPAVVQRPVSTARAWAPTRNRGDPEASRLRILAEAKQRTIDDLEEFRRKRLGELQVKLTELKTVYEPAHPVVAATEQSILALSQESPQVEHLRSEQRELLKQLAALAPQPDAAPVLRAMQDDGPALTPSRHAFVPNSPARDYADQRQRIEVNKLEDMLDRLSAARIEMEATRAAFKFRYSIIEPPSVPKKVTKPKVPVFVGGSLTLAILAAIGVAVLAEVRSGRIEKSWQVERQLGLPLLGEIDTP
jgi:hypothetical protein